MKLEDIPKQVHLEHFVYQSAQTGIPILFVGVVALVLVGVVAWWFLLPVTGLLARFEAVRQWTSKAMRDIEERYDTGPWPARRPKRRRGGKRNK